LPASRADRLIWTITHNVEVFLNLERLAKDKMALGNPRLAVIPSEQVAGSSPAGAATMP
jgi:hypothetical protein